MAEERYYATGKRKRSVARVWMGPGTGQITINKRPFEQYLVRESDRILAVEPLKLAELLEKLKDGSIKRLLNKTSSE